MGRCSLSVLFLVGCRVLAIFRSLFSSLPAVKGSHTGLIIPKKNKHKTNKMKFKQPPVGLKSGFQKKKRKKEKHPVAFNNKKTHRILPPQMLKTLHLHDLMFSILQSLHPQTCSPELLPDSSNLLLTLHSVPCQPSLWHYLPNNALQHMDAVFW